MRPMLSHPAVADECHTSAACPPIAISERSRVLPAAFADGANPCAPRAQGTKTKTKRTVRRFKHFLRAYRKRTRARRRAVLKSMLRGGECM